MCLRRVVDFHLTVHYLCSGTLKGKFFLNELCLVDIGLGLNPLGIIQHLFRVGPSVV